MCESIYLSIYLSIHPSSLYISIYLSLSLSQQMLGQPPISFRILLAIMGGALLEAFTGQIDNLCVPLFTFALLRM